MSEAALPTTHETERVFLVVVDDSAEMDNALRFACRRAQHTSGRVALLYVIERIEFQHWVGVGRMMEDEARQDAEQRLQSLAARAFAQTGLMPILHIREGKRAEEVFKLLGEDPSISLLVLATATDGANPGPIVTYLLANISKGKMRVPLTLVPGQLSPDEIDLMT